ncbi:ATP-binding protein [Hyperthermus butylicus]|uniref:NadR/Ttd14 AAA domain-containing protein n=1 Tax=Hyperthermus butylicus (strain DSM 5456 / JCM 9403 / PLM1-5) TaxID=415426 RepID=A2BKP7_HYPBU|nr:ATP-binding protein [Hyperthermus butylicus]ABM80558.1 hypothetical protein Hbut_0703 [Hyperthermus butylicus DSM 5456]
MADRLLIVFEGGPGIGKTTLSRLLAELLERRGRKTCVVWDAVRGIAPVLSRLFGEWYRAPRELIEYMFLGYQLRRLHECVEADTDTVILDYGVEAPLAYMEADGVPYPKELEELAEAVLSGWRVVVFILEQPVAYSTDVVRWEDPRRAQGYARRLIARALSLVERLGAVAYVLPEKPSVEERALLAPKNARARRIS